MEINERRKLIGINLKRNVLQARKKGQKDKLICLARGLIPNQIKRKKVKEKIQKRRQNG